MKESSYMYPESLRSNLLKMGFLLLLSVIVALLFNAVRPQGIPLVENWKEKMATRQMPEGIQRMSFNQVTEHFKTGDVLFLDARDAAFYERNHIRGAVNLPVQAFDTIYPDVKDKLGYDKLIIVYCDGNQCEMSDELATRLIAEGYTQLGVYIGGIEEWMERGMPVSTGEGS